MSNYQRLGRPAEILLIEDNPADVELTCEALAESRMTNRLHLARDGVEALEFLRRAGRYADAVRPDLVLLDLNLPRKDGRELLAELKSDDALRLIPVIVLTTSKADDDVIKSYKLNANSYIVKPIDFAGFAEVVRAIEGFWFTVVTFPRHS